MKSSKLAIVGVLLFGGPLWAHDIKLIPVGDDALLPLLIADQHVSVTPVALDFGEVAVGQSRTLSLQVENLSQQVQSVSVSIAGGGGAVSVGEAAFELAAGAPAHPVELTYAPSEEGSLTASVTVSASDPQGYAKSVEVVLSGTAVVAKLVAYLPFTSTSVTIGELEFGAVVAGNGNGYSYEFLVGNVGDAITEGAGIGPPVGAGGCTGPATNRLCFQRRSGSGWLAVTAFPAELDAGDAIHLRAVWTPSVQGVSPPGPVTILGGVDPLVLAVTGTSVAGGGAIVQLLDAELPDRPVISEVALDAEKRIGDQTLVRRIIVRNLGTAATVGGLVGVAPGTACIADAYLNKCFYAADGSSAVQLPLDEGAEVEVELLWSYAAGETVDTLNTVWFTNGSATNPQSAQLKVQTTNTSKAQGGPAPGGNGGTGTAVGGGGQVGAPDEFGGVRGLLNDNLFLSDTEIDSVNRMNGNLVVTIPLGPPLAVGPSFTYQLALVHNSNKWLTRVWEDLAPPDPLFNGNAFTVPVQGNAGLGWNVSLGGELYVSAFVFGGTSDPEFFPYDWPSRGLENWVYVDASGGSHQIGASNAALGMVSNDGSNIRVRGGPTDPLVYVDLPSGLVQSYERYASHCPAVNSSGLALCRRLSKIEDPFGNAVSITYDDVALSATVVDSYGHRIVVRYRGFNPLDVCNPPQPTCLGPGAQTSTRRVVDSIEFPATGGRTAVWDFATHDQLMNRNCEVSPSAWTASELRLKVPILDGIDFKTANGTAIPNSGSYAFGYAGTSYSPTSLCKVDAGELVAIETPSKARIEYDYKNVFLPIGCSSVNSNEPPDTAQGRGILERRVLPHDSSAPRSWQRFSYHRTDRSSATSVCTRDNTMETHVVHGPAMRFGNAEHYRHEISFHTLTQTKDNLPAGGQWALRDYGLPITKNNSYSIVGAFNDRLFLSSMVYDCDNDGTFVDIADPAPPHCTLHRRAYRSYAYKTFPESCESPAGRFLGCKTLARPLRGVREYHGAEWIETHYDDYDGYGAFRTATTKSNFGGPTITTSESTHTYVLANGVPASYSVAVDAAMTLAGVLPDSAQVTTWILSLYDQKLSNPDGAVRKTTFEFDDRGFLTCRRSFAAFGSGALGQDQDVTVRYVDNPLDGRPDLERWAGGDEGSAGQTGCDGPTEYALEHTYDRGQLATSRFLVGTVQVGPLLADNTFDASTGLLSRSCDNSIAPKLCVQFGYDLLGRKTLEDPVDGRAVRRDFAYQLGSEGGGTITITSTDETNGQLADQAQLTVDEFGRDKKVRRRVSTARKDPRNTSAAVPWIRQAKQYHGHDLLAVVTGVYDEAIWDAMHSDARVATRYKYPDYDIHGRLLHYQSPRGETVDFAYFDGASNARVETVPYGNGSVKTRSKFDHLGRTVKLWEGMLSGDIATADRLTDFTYSSGVETAIRSEGATTQRRKRFLDGRGFLVREEVPEKFGPAGPVTYTYDPRGNALAVDDAGTVVASTYDGAGRLREVRSGAGRLLETRTYYPNSQQGGRLQKARRFNYFGLGETGGYAEVLLHGAALLIFEVEDAFTYDNRGNVASKETRIERVRESAAGLEVERTLLVGLRATWTYDGLGRVRTQSDPQCFIGDLCNYVTAAGLKKLDLRRLYDLGELVTIEASNAPGATPIYHPLLGFKYHPSGGLRRIDRYNLAGGSVGYDERLEFVHQAADPSNPARYPELTLPRVGSLRRFGAGGGAPLWTTGAYGYDGQARIQALGPTRWHIYDRIGRLSSDGVHDYAYDDFDNLLAGDNPALTFTVNSNTNRLDTVSLPTNPNAPVTYDPRGNLTDAVGAHTRYDPFGRAKSWWWDIYPQTAYDYQALYLYGPDGSRAADLSRLPTSDGSTPGVVDPAGLLDADFSEILVTFHGPDGSPLRELRWTDEINTGRSLAVGSRTFVGRSVVVSQGSDGTGDQPYRLRHLTSDHLGTPRYARTYDGLTGTLVSSNADDGYAPYGYNEEPLDNRIRESLGFAGHWNDRNAPNFALPRDGNPFTLNMGARSYLPDVGRFLAVDPARDSSAWSLYAYAANDPVNKADSTGLAPVEKQPADGQFLDPLGMPTDIDSFFKTPDAGATPTLAQRERSEESKANTRRIPMLHDGTAAERFNASRERLVRDAIAEGGTEAGVAADAEFNRGMLGPAVVATGTMAAAPFSIPAGLGAAVAGTTAYIAQRATGETDEGAVGGTVAATFIGVFNPIDKVGTGMDFIRAVLLGLAGPAIENTIDRGMNGSDDQKTDDQKK